MHPKKLENRRAKGSAATHNRVTVIRAESSFTQVVRLSNKVHGQHGIQFKKVPQLYVVGKANLHSYVIDCSRMYP